MAISGIVFDLDDTLYPEIAFVHSGFRAVAEQVALSMGNAAAHYDWLLRRHATGPRGRLFDDLLTSLNLPADPGRVEQLVRLYRTHSPTIELHDDAARALQRCMRRGNVGIVSDGPWEMQRNKVRALPLPPGIEPIILTDQWGREFWKPHKRAFESVMSQWKADGSTLAYVADNPAKDFVAPNALGWTTVQIVRPQGEYCNTGPPQGGEPLYVITTLDDLHL